MNNRQYVYEREIGTRGGQPLKAVVYRGHRGQKPSEWVLAIVGDGQGMIVRRFKTMNAAIHAASGQEWKPY